MPLLQRQLCKRLLQLEKLRTIAFAHGRMRILPFLLRQGAQCLVKFSPRMRPTAHHTDVTRQLMIPLVSVRVQPAREALQETIGVLRFPRGLVFIQHNGLFRAAAGAVQPHVGLAGGGTSRLFQHLQGRLIRVQHRLLAKPLMQRIVDRLQPLL